MIKQFDDNSYIEIKKYDGKVAIIIAGLDAENSKTVIINSAEVTEDEFKELISDIVAPLPEPTTKKKRAKTTKKKTAKKKTTKKKTKKTTKEEPVSD